MKQFGELRGIEEGDKVDKINEGVSDEFR